MIKAQLEELLKETIKDLGFLSPTDIVLTISENSDFGDYSTNIPLQLSKQQHQKTYQNPREIASAILEKLGHPHFIERIEIAGPGFLNFFIKSEYLAKSLSEILEKNSEFGKNNSGNGKKVQVEFISANPTGPLTLANGRGGAIGDSLANIFSSCGYEVDREYYLNDTGNQIRTLGESVLAASGLLPKKESHYQAGYIQELADRFNEQTELEPQELGHMLADYLLDNEIKPAISKLGIKFDSFFSERSLYPEKIETAVAILKDKNLAYEKDGALWFKAKDFGDTEDRVLMTSEEGRGRAEPTYFLADIAHHIAVFEKGFEFRVNILGADHHSYMHRLQSVLDALGYKNQSQVILMQMIRLFKEGKEIRMSKRAGNFVTLDELLAEIPADVAKFFFLMYAPTSHINFDLDLAKDSSDKNPVFYTQYAHARMCSILKKQEFDPKIANLDLLVEIDELELIKELLEFPGLILKTSKDFQVHLLTNYARKIAELTNRFYEKHSVMAAGNEGLVQARMALVKSSQIVLKSTLDILGVSAPERM